MEEVRITYISYNLVQERSEQNNEWLKDEGRSLNTTNFEFKLQTFLDFYVQYINFPNIITLVKSTSRDQNVLYLNEIWNFMNVDEGSRVSMLRH